MLKNALVTVVAGEKYERIWAKTRSYFEAYAQKIGAELIVLGYHENVPSQHWVKFSLYEMLRKQFKRAVYLDADILIRDDCPNLFEIVPETKLGIFNEGRYTPRAICIYEVMNSYKIELPDWDRNSYYNTGVMVVSRDQRHIFKPPDTVHKLKHSFGEQTFLNFRILGSKVSVFELSHKFNHMSLMDRLTGKSRRAAYIVHYAGPPSEKLLHEAIDADIEGWEKEKPDYEYNENIFINIGGGLGDQVCAEPIIRYIREKVFPKADIYAATAYPRLFEHIDKVSFDTKMPEKSFDAIFSMDTHPDQRTPFGVYVVYTHTHQVDYISLVTLRRTIPDMEKRIKLIWTQTDVAEVEAFTKIPEDLVLVHAGKGWPSKTFPLEYWQEVADALQVEGYKVGLIGASVNEEHNYVPIKARSGMIDFRDKLSLGGLIYLLSRASVLISNDSGPIHLAGAFDNGIILIPTCKHPEHLLPYRYGDKNYRAKALYKKLACEEISYVPTGTEAFSIRDVLGDILEYVPDVQTIIEEVNNMTGDKKDAINAFLFAKKGKEYVKSNLESN